MEHTKGVIKGPEGAAHLLNVNPGTLRSKVIRYGLLQEQAEEEADREF